MIQKTFKCCSKKPVFLITYSVSDSKKAYLVCSECSQLECFSKYIISKTHVENNSKKIDSEIFEGNENNETEYSELDEECELDENTDGCNELSQELIREDKF